MEDASNTVPINIPSINGKQSQPRFQAAARQPSCFQENGQLVTKPERNKCKNTQKTLLNRCHLHFEECVQGRNICYILKLCFEDSLRGDKRDSRDLKKYETCKQGKTQCWALFVISKATFTKTAIKPKCISNISLHKLYLHHKNYRYAKRLR